MSICFVGYTYNRCQANGKLHRIDNGSVGVHDAYMAARPKKRRVSKEKETELAPPTHLRAWRLAFGWTQEYLAELMELAAHTQISYWENGKNNNCHCRPYIEQARLFGITPGRLIDGPPPLASDFRRTAAVRQPKTPAALETRK